jgi:hypothetical protein
MAHAMSSSLQGLRSLYVAYPASFFSITEQSHFKPEHMAGAPSNARTLHRLRRSLAWITVI